VQVLSILKRVVFKYFKILKQGFKSKDDQESDLYTGLPQSYHFCQNQNLGLLNTLGKSRLLTIKTDTHYIASDKMLLYFKISLIKQNDLQNIQFEFIRVTLNLLKVHSS